jgi:hypothetical protein
MLTYVNICLHMLTYVNMCKRHMLTYVNKFQSKVFHSTLNHFIFKKFIPRIYDVEHYKQFIRNHNNSVITKKIFFNHRITISKNFIVKSN